ncbi:hypothetical protein [Pelagibaculum spongiae]|uniref:Uncharacterized protein n=1 Tax=Pelagibaculum spongiae TaxID=2080658 RepID=A0A2V1GZ62_9GAMM|nr:hypothetical protein [Pelagibaculum spongiae]PVZ68346.1 hypothetical protein DC094_13760 [Pelagibaculum spongiae]
MDHETFIPFPTENRCGFSVSFKGANGKSHTCSLFPTLRGWCFFNSKNAEKGKFKGSALYAGDLSAYSVLIDRIFALTTNYQCNTVQIIPWHCPSIEKKIAEDPVISSD